MKPRPKAWLPAKYEAGDIEAIKALSAGNANERQQKRALGWIINAAAETYDQAYRSDADGGERETSFALGRAFVGQQIVKLVNMPPELMAKIRKSND